MTLFILPKTFQSNFKYNKYIGQNVKGKMNCRQFSEKKEKVFFCNYLQIRFHSIEWYIVEQQKSWNFQYTKVNLSFFLLNKENIDIDTNIDDVHIIHISSIDIWFQCMSRKIVIIFNYNETITEYFNILMD